MKFVKYSSIENATRVEAVNAIIQQGHSSGEWCAANKIHGGNYQFKYDNHDLRVGKRSSLLDGDGGGFYGSYNVYAKYSDKIRALYLHLLDLYDFTEMTCYGEIFGGSYPHKDVARDPKASKVQNGIFYCPHNDFYMFDIRLTKNEELVQYLNKDYVEELGKQFDIPCSVIMYRGTLDEMLALDPVFEDPLHKYFKLPALESNQSEGYVIAPIVTKFFNSGSRVILKRRNPKFEGKSHKKERKPIKPLPPEAEALLDEGLRYINENRLKNVISHGYDFTIKDFGKLMGLFSKDIYEAFVKDNKEAIDAMEKPLFKKVSKKMNFECANLIRKSFINIIDGNF